MTNNKDFVYSYIAQSDRVVRGVARTGFKRHIHLDVMPCQYHFPSCDELTKDMATTNYHFSSWKEARIYFSGYHDCYKKNVQEELKYNTQKRIELEDPK